MASLPENMSVAIDELEAAITEMESRLESAHAERDEAKARQVELEIENTNLRRELTLARERQGASAEILGTIANTNGDAEHALQQIAETARHFFDASSVTIRITDGKEWIRTIRVGGGSERVMAAVPARELAVDGKNVAGLVYRENRQIHVPDLDHVDASIADFPGLAPARAGGSRTVSGTPLRLGAGAIGAMIIHRDRLAAFADEELALQQSFADQAVIAIENARLFNETREALERQTATADILKVIASSPADVQPVFDAIVSSAAKLFEPCSATITTLKDDKLHWNATATSISGFDIEGTRTVYPIPFDPDRAPSARAILEHRIIEIPDIAAPDTPEFTRKAAAAGGFRSITFVPLIDQDQGIGTIIFTHPQPGYRFSERQLALIQTFADQAVIAIQNARLFNETREALERQIATADVLKVIASSPSDVQPVFAAIASSAKRLLDGFTATVLQFRDDQLHLVAFTPTSPEADHGLQASFPQPVAEFPVFGLVRDGATIQFPDTEADGVPAMNRDLGRLRGFRSVLFVPLMNQGKAAGILSVTRTEPGAFADHHVQLLQTFADQAVIAIENTRLFNETQQALERQKASADILRVIASSPSDTTPVFEAIASSAKRLLGGFSASVFRFVDGNVYLRAFTPTNPAADESFLASFPRPVAEFEPFRLVQHGQPMIPDTEDISNEQIKEIARQRGFRSMLFVPLMNGGIPIGIISVTRLETGSYAAHHVELLQTFADQAVIAIENTRLFNETKEALERQTATADILKVIASSPSDTQPVFEAIAHSAKRLVGGFSTGVYRVVDDVVHLAAFTPTSPEADEALKAGFPLHRTEIPALLLVQDGVTAQIADSETADPHTRKLGRARGWRSVTFAPLMSQGVFIGFIVCTRRETGLLADHHVQLLRTFADQAVIAIENTRLFNETEEALERQTATADILKVIASSPSDTTPVFDAIASSAKRLLSAFGSAVFRLVDDTVHLAAHTPVSPAADTALEADFPRPIDDDAFRMAMQGRPFAIPDTEEASHEPIKQIARVHGFRSMLYVPMMNAGVPIGIISATRVEPGAFAPHHVQLLQTFADQAVIAIENTRLFNETKDALERQTATADILKVIASSPSDVQPVFDTIVHSANRLIGGFSTAVFRYGDGKIHLAAFTPTDAEGDAFLQSSFPVPFEQFPPYQLTREGAPAELPDTELEPAARDIARARGYRSMLFAPLMNEGEAVGIITVTRVAPGPFGEQHTRLLQMFADQAVIAIRNVGLFNEVQQRTEDLAESLQQQMAVGDVLKTISRSTFELQPVLDTLVNSAQQLCDADMAFIMRRVGDEYRAGAAVGYTQAYIDFLTNHPLAVNRGTVTGRAVLERRPVQIPDVVADPEYTLHETTILAGQRTTVGVPLLRENEPIGVIVLARQRVEPFTQKQIDLVATFADQAVIAIENVRLFNETREALERQTATSDILKVIASSPSDVQPVFDVIVERAVQLCGARIGRVYRYDGELIHLVGGHGLSVPGREGAQRPFPRPASDDTIVGRVMLSRAPFILADLNEDDSVPPLSRQMITAIGARSQVTMPMLLAGQPIGAITLSWAEPRGYTDQQIALLRTFADQAVIAIENTRLFNEVRQRTEDLSESLQQQTATADVLKVISRSAFDLETVLNTLTESAASLCDADMAAVTRPHPEGGYHHATRFNFPPEWERINETVRLYPDRGSLVGRVLLEGKAVQIRDVVADPEYAFPEHQRVGGYRTLLGVPLLREGQPTGVLFLGRTRVEPFTDRQIELVQTFADQAVIAIENVRLFDEVQAKTRDLEEALTYQTGSANILRVIASSPTDVAPVLDAIASSACELCDASDALVFLKEDDRLGCRAHHGPIPVVFTDTRPINRGYVSGRTVVDKVPVHVTDIFSEEGADFPEARELSRSENIRSILCVPMLREGESVGAILLRRTEVNPFSDKQLSLLQTFADQAVIAIGNVRLFEEVQAKTRDLEEALTYQTGSSNILRVIASSPTDVKPVLQAIVESACELCGAYDALVRLKDGDELAFGAHHGPLPVILENVPINESSTAGLAMIECKPVHVHDLLSDEGDRFPRAQAMNMGERTILSVPLLREGEGIGAIVIRRREVNPFTDKQIALLQTFADQAVIAIGNVRLFEEVQAKTRDLEEALTYQTGSSNILRVIASSPTDVKPVLKAIVESACELCGAYDALLRLKDGDHLAFGAHHGSIPVDADSLPISRQWTGGLAVIEQRPVHIHDLLSSEGDPFPEAQGRARRYGHRAVLTVPLLREGESVGAIMLRRNEAIPFTDKQIALLQTFADQAVIAIGNVRLFEQVQERTRELSESLQFQTASSEVLKVISSSPDALQPVLDAIAHTSQELCGSDNATIVLFRDGKAQFAAVAGASPAHYEYLRSNPASIDEPGSLFDRMIRQKRTLHFPNVMDDPEISQKRRTAMGGPRALLVTPLLRDGEPLGAIVLRQTHLKPFTPRQVQAIEVFADQAVIAISNVELFEQVQQRTRELSESLEQQTATSEVLSVISRSAGDLAPVFDTMLRKAMELCGGNFGTLNTYDGNRFHTAATYGLPPAYYEYRRNQPPQDYGPGTAPAVLLGGEPHVEAYGLIDSESYRRGDPNRRALVDIGGAQCLLAVPLLKDERVVGSVMIFRQEDRPFSEKQITLLKQFAAQAVIAIENARLLNELRQRTDDLGESLQQQTATADVLQIISSSPGELAPVFEKMLENATRVCGAKFGSMLLAENGSMRPAATYNVPAEFAAARGDRVLTPHPKSSLAKAISTKQVVHVADMRTTEAYLERSPASIEFVELGGARTVAIVPMVRDDEVIGAITVYRNVVQLFSDKQIELLSNFAKQAVIAIENARLLKELRQRTDDLSQSLDDLRTAQDRLVQTEKLASLGQLTAGIAHEIKNPLNFVNNFAALSAELTQELKEVLKPAGIGDKMRAEVNELTGLLKDNLEKVVQHGKRADSIVKNMLLHSREGGGEHRPSDINALVDESLNLAYHGARAEKPGFNVTLERDFDPTAGQVDLFPQEITRVFLNLISNGFYAVTKRSKEDGAPGFEPTLRATTKNLGESVEIRIRDNGIGIPAEVKEKMFNPFFTTKPAGEGTGLGLSMSHDIIVKQHGGTIDVDTSPGLFTEFRIVLPRTSNFAEKSRG